MRRNVLIGLVCLKVLLVIGFLLPDITSKDVVKEEENIFESSILEYQDEEVENYVINNTQNSNEGKINYSENNVNDSISVQSGEEYPKEVFNGEFMKIDYDVEGSFKLYELENGNYGLRIENLDITNGPDLQFVLTNEFEKSLTNYVLISNFSEQEFVNKGSYNIEISNEVLSSTSDMSIEDFNYLVIHCVKYNHAFAGGVLQ